MNEDEVGSLQFASEQLDLSEPWQRDGLRARLYTLRKTAGSMYYLATNDIFATSRFLGHSSVKVTEKHYAGLNQSLQIEHHQKFEESVRLRLLHGRYD